MERLRHAIYGELEGNDALSDALEVFLRHNLLKAALRKGELGHVEATDERGFTNDIPLPDTAQFEAEGRKWIEGRAAPKHAHLPVFGRRMAAAVLLREVRIPSGSCGGIEKDAVEPNLHQINHIS